MVGNGSHHMLPNSGGDGSIRHIVHSLLHQNAKWMDMRKHSFGLTLAELPPLVRFPVSKYCVRN